MSQSLMIANGDLSVAGRSLQVVSGQDKLLQDLMCWILEPVGTDPATPTAGSTLDGGIVNGQFIPSYIGDVFSTMGQLAIQAEVEGIVKNYQTYQLQKMQGEAYQYGGKTTLTQDEVISSIDNVTSTFTGGVLIVQVFITTLSNTSLQVTIPVSA